MLRDVGEGGGGVGGWAKKNTHQVFGLERLRKVSCVAGAGRGSLTHVCDKRQVIAAQVERRNFHNVRSFSRTYLFICLNAAAHSAITDAPAGVYQVNTIGTSAKYKPADPILSANMRSCQRGGAAASKQGGLIINVY